jgi:hydroxymethylbilane synthase
MMLRIATRGSPLARWQAEHVRELLRGQHPGLAVELVIITSAGDLDRSRPLHEIGGVGLFTKEVQEAVLAGRADLAVHSLKDLPTQSPTELQLAAVPMRGTCEDALIAPCHRTLANLPAYARVGTSSLRRRAQLLRIRPDLEIIDVRGNVETRLRKLEEDQWDAILLAAAGLERLGLQDRITERLGVGTMLPAVGQGALGIECRSDDTRTADLLKPLNHDATRLAVTAERTFLATLEGGCQLPIGALATMKGETITLVGNVTAVDGSVQFSGSCQGTEPVELGRRLAQKLLAEGACGILAKRP